MVSTGASFGPTSDYLALVRTPPSALSGVIQRGDTPDLEALVGREWRGTNMPATSVLFGLRRFIKGFVDEAGTVSGYNVSVAGADLSAPWRERLQRDGRREWAPFTVAPVDPTQLDNRYLHALLIDYAAAPKPERGLPGMLRDYLVRVVPGSDELLLGRAFLAFGARRMHIGWFALEPLD